jgi:hypothetical protein
MTITRFQSNFSVQIAAWAAIPGRPLLSLLFGPWEYSDMFSPLPISITLKGFQEAPASACSASKINRAAAVTEVAGLGQC